MRGSFFLRRDEFAHLLDDFQNPPLLFRHTGEDVLRLGVVGFLGLDEAEAGEGEVVAVLDDALRRDAPRDAVGSLAPGPFLQEVGEVVAELRTELARLFQRRAVALDAVEPNVLGGLAGLMENRLVSTTDNGWVRWFLRITEHGS